MSTENAIEFNESGSPVSNWFIDIFSIDARSLAVLRVLMALMVLFDLALRATGIKWFYSDEGVLTLQQARDFLGPGYWTLYSIGESTWISQMLMFMTGVAAIGLLVGFKTKWMNVICLVLIWSLQIRNPLVLTAGHVLLRMMLFWMLFLPTSEIWSIDSATEERNQPRRWIICSVASAAIMLQLAYMYFFSGLAKLNNYWLEGHALEYSLNLEMYVRPLGEWMSHYPTLLQTITLITLVAEIVGPICMFLPGINKFARGMLMAIFMILHIGIWLSLSIGIFSAVAICAWVIFVPPEIWNGLIGEPVGFQKGDSEPESSPVVEWTSGLVAAVFLIYITLQNIATTASTDSDWLQRFGRTTMTIQEFRMFDTPPLYSPWFEYLGFDSNGNAVDLFAQTPTMAGKKPESVYQHMKSQHWRRFHWNLTTHPDLQPENMDTYREIRQGLLEKMVDRWNRLHPDNRIQKAELVCHLDAINLGYEAERPGKTLLWASVDSTGANRFGR